MLNGLYGRVSSDTSAAHRGWTMFVDAVFTSAAPDSVSPSPRPLGRIDRRFGYAAHRKTTTTTTCMPFFAVRGHDFAAPPQCPDARWRPPTGLPPKFPSLEAVFLVITVFGPEIILNDNVTAVPYHFLTLGGCAWQ